MSVAPRPGQTHSVNLGGSGCAIVGKINLHADRSETEEYLKNAFDPKWTRCRTYLATEIDEDGNLPEDAPVFGAKVEKDGGFRIDDVPPGDYEFSVDLHAAQMWNTCGFPLVIAAAKTRFVVPAEQSESPINLADVTLEPAPRIDTGDHPPQIREMAFTGTEFALSKLQGKFVLLDFWAMWCAPCLENTPMLKKIHEKYSDNERFEIVGLNLDPGSKLQKAKDFIREQNLNWTHVEIGEWEKDNRVTKAYGIPAIPSYWLIGPEGKVLARDIDPETLEKVVEEAVVIGD